MGNAPGYFEDAGLDNEVGVGGIYLWCTILPVNLSP